MEATHESAGRAEDEPGRRGATPPDGNGAPVWGRGPVAPDLVRKFERAVGAWDRHIGSCGHCLHQGRWFCAEGEDLTREVGRWREKLAEPAAPPRSISRSVGIGRWLTGQGTARLP